MTALAPLIKPFFSHYLPIQRGLSVNTVASYRDAIRLLLCYLADAHGRSVDALHIEDMTAPAIVDFLDHLESHRGCSTPTRNSRLAAIRSLFAFLARQQPELLDQCQQVRAIPLKRTATRPVDYLEEDEMQAILNAVDPTSRTGIRDHALLMVLYNTGARVSEITALELPDLHLRGRPELHLLGKGNKARACPVWSETVSAIRQHLAQRTAQQPDEPRLFLNANGAPITRFGIRHIVNKYAAKAALQCPSLADKNVTVHTLRHTTAMHLLRAGNDLFTVSYWLGHADVNTTHVYLEIDMAMKRKMIEKTPPPEITKPPPWKKPGMIEWLNQLGRRPELCGVHPAKRPKNPRSAPSRFT